MPTDMILTWDQDIQGCKLAFESNDVVTSKSLLTPVLVSLFTDARATDDDPLPDPLVSDRRGWWGDATNTDKLGDFVGSKLWLLEREKNSNQALLKAKAYIEEALKWMLDEGICKSILVTTESQQVKNSGTIILAFQVKLNKPDGTTEAYKFEQEWGETANGI